MAENTQSNQVLITSLLKRLWPNPTKENVTAAEIADAVSHIFTNSLSPVQTGALLTALHFTGLDRQPDVLALSAQAMRRAAAQINDRLLRDVVQKRGRIEGNYHGGLVCEVFIL
jgi:anthranilate phosphoribosyltransferase